MLANAVHAVVPVAAANQRQAQFAGQLQALVEAAGAVLEQRSRRIGLHRLEERIMFASGQQRAFEKVQLLIENCRIAAALDVLRSGVGQPHPVIGDARAHALAGMWQPPVLYVALDKLTAGGAQDMPAGDRWAGEGQRHAVLQLVAEAVGAAGLVERRARPNAASQGLIEQPAVEHDVHGAAWRLHLHRAEYALPVRLHLE